MLAAGHTLTAWLRAGLAFLAAGLAARRAPLDVPRAREPRVPATVPVARAVARFGATAVASGQPATLTRTRCHAALR